MARPVEYDREQVLERAMQTFWEAGYDATSIAHLTKATALKPGSLYAAFQSKDGLFRAVLDHYAAGSVARIRQTLASADTPLAGVRVFFRQLAASATEPEAQRSCLLVNTVLEVARHDPALRERVNQHLAAVEALFRETLDAAQARGELAADRDVAGLAALLVTMIWGLRVRLAADVEPQRARAVVEQVLQLLESSS